MKRLIFLCCLYVLVVHFCTSRLCAQDSLNIASLGILFNEWGYVGQLATSEDQVLVSVGGHGWALIDRSDPENPVQTDIILPYPAPEIIEREDTLLLAFDTRHDDSVLLYNISDLAEPVLYETIEDYVYGGEFMDLHYPYISVGSAWGYYTPDGNVNYRIIDLYDISDQENPFCIYNYTEQVYGCVFSYYTCAVLWDDYVIIGAQDGLYSAYIYYPEYFPQYEGCEEVIELFLNDSLLYVLWNNAGINDNGRLSIYSMSEVTELELEETINFSRHATDLKVDGDTLIIQTTEASSYLHLYDISEPANPTPLFTTFTQDQRLRNFDISNGILTSADSDSCYTWIRTENGYSHSGTFSRRESYLHNIALINDFAYVGWGDTGFGIVCLTDAGMPSDTAKVHQGIDIQKVYTFNDKLFVFTHLGPGQDYQLQDYNISNPWLPSLQTIHTLEDCRYYNSPIFYQVNDTSLIANYTGDDYQNVVDILRIDNISTMFNRFTISGRLLYAGDNRLYVKTYSSGLDVYNIEDPLNPFVEANLNELTCIDFLCYGNTAYATMVDTINAERREYEFRLDILDMTNIQDPQVINTMEMNAEPGYSCIQENSLILEIDDTLFVYNLADVHLPELTGHYPLVSAVSGLAVHSGERMLISNGAYLNILDADEAFPVTGVSEYYVSTPDKCVITGIYPNPFNSMVNIGIQLPSDGRIMIKVFNSLGQEVYQTNYSEVYSNGEHQVLLDGSHWASGCYFILAEILFSHSRQQIPTQRVVLVK